MVPIYPQYYGHQGYGYHPEMRNPQENSGRDHNFSNMIPMTVQQGLFPNPSNNFHPTELFNSPQNNVPHPQRNVFNSQTNIPNPQINFSQQISH